MAQKKSTTVSNNNTQVQFVFGKSNYRLMIISIAVVVLGFILMVGDTNIYGFRKIILAPIIVLIGFALGFFAILKKRR